MSALVARLPLHPLEMSAAQRTKRKTTARVNMDDEDIQPAKKKSRVEAEPKSANGDASGRPSRRKKPVYEEEVDGFAFRRKNPKRTPNEAPVAAAAEPELVSIPVPAPRRKKSPKSVQPPANSRETRRSARLSAETEVLVEETSRTDLKTQKSRKADPPKSPPTTIQEDESRTRRGLSTENTLQVKKNRSKGTTIALPFADTPIIKRNKEMRAAGGRNSSQNRRSSSGTRGRRASSLIDSGTSNAVPHTDVEVEEYYKLIEQSLPERKRMRHLLIWCATRALLDKPRPKAGQSTIETIAIESARQIQEELIKDFSAKEELSDWWSREDQPGPTLPKKPNPRNIRNQEKLEELEEEIKRLEAEEKSWKALVSGKTSTPSDPPSDSESQVDASLLSEAQRSLLSTMGTSVLEAESLSASLTSLATSLEPTVDAFADGIHRLTTYANSSTRLADKIKSVWAERLEKRDREARKAAGSDTVAGRDVLRALAGRLNDG